MDRGAYLSFVGHVADEGDHILVVGPTGEVRLEGTPGELQAARDLISGLDGFTPLGSLVHGDGEVQVALDAFLGALGEVGALLDQARAWFWFHELSSNPPIAPVAPDPMAAYDMPRLSISGSPCVADLGRLERSWVDVLACERQSADLGSAAIAPDVSLRSAIRLAGEAYMPRLDDRRPVASGGALYPLHFWVVGTDDLAAPRQVLGIEHDEGKVRRTGAVTLQDLQGLFVPDPDVAVALDRGAAVIVIAADPRRVTHKYGNRGWRFALMECGAVMHHITLAAACRNEAVRPIGGYFDLAVQRAICDPALPVLTVFVAAEQ